MRLSFIVLVGLGGYVVNRIDSKVSLFGRRLHHPLKSREIVCRSIPVEPIKQVFAKSFTQILKVRSMGERYVLPKTFGSAQNSPPGDGYPPAYCFERTHQNSPENSP